MAFDQRQYPYDLADTVAWIASLVPPGGRVLEIGSGDGAVVEALTARGIDIVGVDPSATDRINVSPIGFEELDAAPFDVVYASVSLHHLADPACARDALRRLTKPGTIMAIREFDRLLMDEGPTLEWWFHQRHARRAADQEDAFLRGDPHAALSDSFEPFRKMWREMMEHHVLPWQTVLEVLTGAGFTTESVQATPYLFRWDLDEAVRPLEEHLIATNRIRAIGIRWMGRRNAVD